MLTRYQKRPRSFISTGAAASKDPGRCFQHTGRGCFPPRPSARGGRGKGKVGEEQTEERRRGKVHKKFLQVGEFTLAPLTTVPWGPTQSKPSPFRRRHFCTPKFWEATSPSLTNFAPDLIQHRNHGPQVQRQHGAPRNVLSHPPRPGIVAGRKKHTKRATLLKKAWQHPDEQQKKRQNYFPFHLEAFCINRRLRLLK